MFGQNDSDQVNNTALVSPSMPTNTNDDASINASVSQLVSDPAMGAPAVTTSPFLDNNAAGAPQPLGVPAPAAYTPPMPSSTTSSDTTADDLVQMKQEALKHLQPLVGSLQQSPEEEFRTVMMMIQATDDKTMLKKALESAKKITDDKVRAQAMLDVINEINYFTQTQ